MQIETERLLLRSLRTDDAQALATLWADPKVTQYMGGPRDREKIRQGFEEDAELSPPPEIDLWPVVEKASGQIIGHCGLIDKEVDGQAEFELIYVFAPSVWGKGYATEAASAVKNYAFEELGLERIVSLIDPRNAASERVAIKIGMQFEKETLRPSRKTLRVYALHASDD